MTHASLQLLLIKYIHTLHAWSINKWYTMIHGQILLLAVTVFVAHNNATQLIVIINQNQL